MSKRYSPSDADTERKPPSSVRVLIVDDYEPWRRWVYSELGRQPQLQIVGEASDGLEAVRKARELKPDIILLDIGLPYLNGLEAARRIRTVSPTSKIVFVTQESSPEVVQDALNIGASAYVVKMDAGSELIAAVATVLRGDQFLGSRFVGHDLTRTWNLRTADPLAQDESPESRPIPIWKAAASGRHEAYFYSNDGFLLDDLTQCIGTALNAGSAVIVFANESNRNKVIYRLQTHGIDTTTAIDQRRYIPLDSVDILSKFMMDDLPDPTRLFKVVDNLIKTVSGATGSPDTRVVVCGGLAPILLNEGKQESAIRLEQLWNQVVKRYGLDTRCMYSQSSFESEQGRDVFQRICGLHSSVRSR